MIHCLWNPTGDCFPNGCPGRCSQMNREINKSSHGFKVNVQVVNNIASERIIFLTLCIRLGRQIHEGFVSGFYNRRRWRSRERWIIARKKKKRINPILTNPKIAKKKFYVHVQAATEWYPLTGQTSRSQAHIFEICGYF